MLLIGSHIAANEVLSISLIELTIKTFDYISLCCLWEDNETAILSL